MSRPTSSPEADLNNPPNVFADWSAWGGFLCRLDMNPSINFVLTSFFHCPPASGKHVRKEIFKNPFLLLKNSLQHHSTSINPTMIA